MCIGRKYIARVCACCQHVAAAPPPTAVVLLMGPLLELLQHAVQTANRRLFTTNLQIGQTHLRSFF